MTTNINSILLYNPKQYAKAAIESIEENLKSAKSPVRIAKLNYRLRQWKKTLEILNEYDEAKAKN
jgi:hypothetical protein